MNTFMNTATTNSSMNTSTTNSSMYTSMDKAQLQTLLDKLSDEYYNNTPSVTDEEFDYIQSIYECKFGKYSKTGARPKSNVAPTLIYPMWGLAKAKTDKDLTLFLKRNPSDTFIVTEKLDGVAVSLEYIDKSTVKLLKRGNGVLGSDVSHLLKWIHYPVLKDVGFPFAIKAELVMKKEVFAKFYPEESNSRNTVSGATNSKTIDCDKLKRIDIVAYHIYNSNSNQEQQLILLKKLGFITPDATFMCRQDITSSTMTDMVIARKKNSVYDVDGVCICSNIANELPTDRDPTHIIAFKIVSNKVETTVVDVIWKVSKHGLIKPTVKIQPVVIDGVEITFATGHNARFIELNKIGPGAIVTIIRSGDVIPYILNVCSEGTPKFPDIPYKWVKNSSGENIEIAINDNYTSTEMDISKMTAFFKEIGTEYLAESTISTLYTEGFDTIPKILGITVDEIVKIEGFKITSATRIVTSIKKSTMNIPLPTLMAASSMFPGLGNKRLTVVCEQVPNILDIPVEELRNIKIEGVKSMIDIIINNLDTFKIFLKEISPFVTIRQQEVSIAKTGNLSGQIIVYSGLRPSEEEKEHITELGGKITSSISGKTTIVVVKYKEGPNVLDKIKKAISDGKNVMTHEEFCNNFLK